MPNHLGSGLELSRTTHEVFLNVSHAPFLKCVMPRMPECREAQIHQRSGPCLMKLNYVREWKILCCSARVMILASVVCLNTIKANSQISSFCQGT